MKSKRQEEILALIQEQNIETQNQLIEALRKGLETAGIAGSLAVGILLTSTVFRLLFRRQHPSEG